MKFHALLGRAQLLIAVLMICNPHLANCQERSGSTNIVPMIQVNDAPLGQMIDLLARQSDLNYCMDPSVSFDRASLVNFRWTNITARAALDRLLKARDLELIENPSTTVARIAPRNLHVKPLDPALVGHDTNNAVPIVQVTDAPLDQAITLLAKKAHLKIGSVEDLIKTPNGSPPPIVSFRWNNLTPRQALVALLDVYDFTLIEDPSTHEFRVKAKSHNTAAAMPLEKSNSGSTGASSARTAVSISVILAQLMVGAPILLVSIAAFAVCLLRWQQGPRPALFCLVGFALTAFNTLFGIFGWAMIYNLMNGDHQRIASAMQVLSIARTVLSSAGLILLLIAVFTGREQRPVSPPPVPV